MECDFPAAHSMDSTWFAVDRDGHVAVFDTGEAGAMPGDAATDEQDLAGRLQRVLPRTGKLHDPAPGLSTSGEQSERHRWFPDSEPKIRGVLMFLESLDPVDAELNRGELFEVPSAQGVAVVWRELSRATYQRLHEQADCLYCTYGGDVDDEEVEEVEEVEDTWVTPSSLANFGFYSYTHVTDNWVAGPYARDLQPAQPITIDELPPDLGRQVRQVRFDDLCFRETTAFQPVEHVACDAWGAAYLASDGKTIRPMPGREADYASEYEEYSTDEKYVAEPPPPGTPRRARPPASRPAGGQGGGLLGRILRRIFGG